MTNPITDHLSPGEHAAYYGAKLMTAERCREFLRTAGDKMLPDLRRAVELTLADFVARA